MGSESFGTLPSELDDDEGSLQPEFVRLMDAFMSVRSAYVAGHLDPEDAASRFSSLRLRESGGKEWTLGATSSRWFSREQGGPWRADSPPAAAVVDPVDVSAADEVPQVAVTASFVPPPRPSEPARPRPVSSAPVDWVLDEWADADFSSGTPASLDAPTQLDAALDPAVDLRPPSPREVDEGPSVFDLESLFMRPEDE